MPSDSVFSSQDTSPEGTSKQLIPALIESVQNRPMLWDKANNDYKKALKKSEMWKIIARESGFKDGVAASTKWGYLRGEYGKQKKKLPSGSSSDDVTGPFFNSMQFLDKTFEERSSHHSNIATESQPKSSTPLEQHEQQMREDNFFDYEDEMLDVVFTTTSVSRPTTPANNTPKISVIKRRKQSEDSLDQAILELLMQQQNETEEELFGKTVAQTLSRLEPKNRKLAQMEIQKVLFNYEFMTQD